MAVYDVRFYDLNPAGVFSTSIGGTTTYGGPATASGFATITDTETGIEETTLDDDNNGSESATADAYLNGVSSIGASVDAELVWTLRDTVTGETFEIIQFEVESGSVTGNYLLSEQPLVPGRTYVTEGYDTNPNVLSGDPVFSQTDYTAPLDGIVSGTSGDDTIDTSYTGDPDGDQIDNHDNITGKTSTAETFSWTAFGGDQTDISSGVSSTIGGIDVDVTFVSQNAASFEVDTGTQYVGAGETFSNTSALNLGGPGGAGDTSTTTIDFGAAAGGGKEDYVENVSFRINDIDGASGAWQDLLTITAIGPDGNPVPVTIVADGNDTASGGSITASTATQDQPTQENGSVFVSIQGPVTQLVIDYNNGDIGGQFVNVTDINFFSVDEFGDQDDLVQAGGGNDVVDSGLGQDSVIGGAGSDSVSGGAGDDTLIGDFDPATTVGAGTPVFEYEYYELGVGTVNNLTEAGFNSSGDNVNAPTATGVTDSTNPPPIDTLNGGDGDTFGVKLTTTLSVTTGGTYDFDLNSDDGARLYIDGVEVIDHDGLHGATTLSGSTFLTPGDHVIEIIYFENGGGSALGLDVSGPDTGGTPVSIESVASLGAAFNDTLSGDAGDDSIIGGVGDDSILGGTGNDTMFGNDDQDTFVIEDGFGVDIVTGGEGGTDYDTLDVSALSGPVTGTSSGSEAGAITLGANSVTYTEIENLTLTDFNDTVDLSNGSLGMNVDAGLGDDIIVGSSGGDTIDGEGGADTIDGGAGDDSISGGAGDDVLSAGNSASAAGDTVDGGAGNDTINESFGNSVLFGGDDADLFNLAVGDATITGGEGGLDDDTISFAPAGSANDAVDVILTGDEQGTYTSVDGDDGVFSEIEAFILSDFDDNFDGSGDSSGIEVDAGAGVDTVTGGSGNDSLDGGLGDDRLTGGAGDDTLTGGDGFDTFVHTPGSGNDVITDFGTATGANLNDGDQTNNDFVDLSAYYDNMSELRADQADDGILNQSNATDSKGRTVDYTNNSSFGPGSLTITGATSSTYSFDNTNVICFAARTMIETESGSCAVEDLRVGDLVKTADHGAQPVRWSGQRIVAGKGRLAPIVISQGTLGATRDLKVSPQHRILISGAVAEALFDEPEVLVPAKHLIGWDGIYQADVNDITYCHILFDTHEIVFAEGVPSESYHPGEVGVSSMEHSTREEIFGIFPELRGNLDMYGPSARKSLRGPEARKLLESCGGDDYMGVL